MDEQPDDAGSKHYQALKDRYPATPETRARLAQDEARELRQVVGELSEVVSALLAYLIDTSRRAAAGDAEAGHAEAEREHQTRLRSLQTDIQTLRERLLDT